MTEAALTFRTSLVTISNADGVSVTLPDLGILTSYVYSSGGDLFFSAQWFDQDRKFYAFSVRRIDASLPGPPGEFVFIGSAFNEATVDALEDVLGPRAFRGPAALLNTPVASVLADAGVKRLRRKDNQALVSPIPPHVLGGHDPFLAAVPLGGDPEDFEVDDA